jgi:hypothetical protein
MRKIESDNTAPVKACAKDRESDNTAPVKACAKDRENDNTAPVKACAKDRESDNTAPVKACETYSSETVKVSNEKHFLLPHCCYTNETLRCLPAIYRQLKQGVHSLEPV